MNEETEDSLAPKKTLGFNGYVILKCMKAHFLVSNYSKKLVFSHKTLYQKIYIKGLV